MGREERGEVKGGGDRKGRKGGWRKRGERGGDTVGKKLGKDA